MLTRVDFLIAGWPCQGFSLAGGGQGLADVRSALFFDLMCVLRWAQDLYPGMAYLLENAPAQFDRRVEVLQDFTVVTHHLGTPFVVDAAQCGSYAHRLRNYWTNLAPLSVLQHSLHGTVRDPHRLVQDILDEDSSPRPVTAQESPPY